MRVGSETINAIRSFVSSVFLGNDYVINILIATAMANGHALLLGPVGSGKTTLAKALAKAIGGRFSRVQVTNETLPSDIIGFVSYGRDGDGKIIKGPIFANVVLLDEINRAPPRTLSALLEAMQEGQVTLEGVPIQLPSPHIILATMNLEEVELGLTRQLPLVILDRFMSSLHVSYVSRDYEKSILANLNFIESRLKAQENPVNSEEFINLVNYVKGIYIDDAIIEYIMNIVEAIRSDNRVLHPLSTRAPISILMLSKALAVLNGRDYVIPDDVKVASYPALNHRITLRPEFSRTLSPIDIINDVLNKVPPPIFVNIK